MSYWDFTIPRAVIRYPDSGRRYIKTGGKFEIHRFEANGGPNITLALIDNSGQQVGWIGVSEEEFSKAVNRARKNKSLPTLSNAIDSDLRLEAKLTR